MKSKRQGDSLKTTGTKNAPENARGSHKIAKNAKCLEGENPIKNKTKPRKTKIKPRHIHRNESS
jgi:hypothetical protein